MRVFAARYQVQVHMVMNHLKGSSNFVIGIIY